MAPDDYVVNSIRKSVYEPMGKYHLKIFPTGKKKKKKKKKNQEVEGQVKTLLYSEIINKMKRQLHSGRIYLQNIYLISDNPKYIRNTQLNNNNKTINLIKK